MAGPPRLWTLAGLFGFRGIGGTQVEDTATLVAETSTEVEPAPETETADLTTIVEETDAETEETDSDFEAKLQAAREEAANEAREALRVELEESQAKERYQREVTEAARYRQSAGEQALQNFAGWLTDQVTERGLTKAEVLQGMNPQVLANLSSNLEAMAATEQWSNIGDSYASYVKKEYPDWKPAPELTRKLESAMARRDSQQMFEARWDFMKAAIKDNEAPEEVQKLLKAEREKSTKAQDVANTQAKDRERAGADRPMNTRGGSAVVGGLNFRTQLEADRAFQEGRITLDQVKQVLAKKLPYS